MAHAENADCPAQRCTVRIVWSGEEYCGTYRVDGPMVTVETCLLGSRRAQLLDDSPEALARSLLVELARR